MPSTPADPPSPALPSAGVRSLISYLLFIHFFLLAVGIKSNTSSSGLDQDLRNRIPGLKQYLQFGAMDLSYMFHLTYYDGFNNIQDTDHFFEVEFTRPDGAAEVVRLSPPSLLPPIRERRYGSLASRAAMYADSQNDNLSSLLPQAVARRMLLERRQTDPDVRSSVIRVRRRLLQNWMLPPSDPEYAIERNRLPEDPAYLQTVYEARVYLTDDGQVEVAHIKSAAETAAPQTPAGNSNRPGASSSSSAVPVPPPTSTIAPTGSPAAGPLGLPVLQTPTFPASVATPTGGTGK